MKREHVLVTGANGFTGSHVVQMLLEQKYKVRGLVRPSSDLSRLQGLDVELVKGEITDPRAIKDAVAGIDRIIHTAAYVDLGIVNQERMMHVNVRGLRMLLKYALSFKVKRFVHCSTIGVFGDTQGQVIDENFVRTQRTFSSAYDRSKYEAQKLVDSYGRRGLAVVSVMPSGIFGLGDPHFGPVIQRFLQGRLKFWAGRARITGIVHVADLSELLIMAAEKGRTGEYYIGSAGELTTAEIFSLLSRQVGIAPPKEIPETLVRMIGACCDPVGHLFSFNPPLSRERVHYIYDRCVRVDATKARHELGWRPMMPEKIIQGLIA